MKVNPTALPGVLVLEPKVFRDARGYFLESYNEEPGGSGYPRALCTGQPFLIPSAT